QPVVMTFAVRSPRLPMDDEEEEEFLPARAKASVAAAVKVKAVASAATKAMRRLRGLFMGVFPSG
ncbi:MAG TPA: hypothetical protein PKZ99_06160, partial [Azospirillaceae bacterium]|nr:hypothetical protein [Azospirillaceae bacterium]